MPRKITGHKIEMDYGDENSTFGHIVVHEGYTVLLVDNSTGGLYIWIEEEMDSPACTLHLSVYVTGSEVNRASKKHLGSTSICGVMYHVYKDIGRD